VQRRVLVSRHYDRSVSIQVVTRGIGTLREKPLHASLKRWYAEPGDREELPVDGYVIDLVRGDLLVEIQTRGFAMIRPKIRALLARGHRVRVVHPIAVDRWIVRVDRDGVFLGRRRSPGHGGLADLAPELVSFPELLADPGLEIEILLTTEEEYRRQEAGRCWRRRGWTVVERRLVDVIDRVMMTRPEDLMRVLPDGLPERFTTADLATRLGRPAHVARQAAYCLRRLGLIEAVGKRGNAVEYRIADDAATGRGPSPRA
jgi:hypothetical protein